jgi:hypothetical protein
VIRIRGETSMSCIRAFACMAIYFGLVFFLAKRSSFLAFQRHQKKVAIEFKFALG